MSDARSDQAIDLLRSIDRSLKVLLARQGGTSSAAAEVADDRDLDGKYGDPVVKFNPRDWTGPSMKGRRMSECPAEFLDQLAEVFDYFASQAEKTGEEYKGKPTAPYKRKDAARARGWAARVRAGKVPAALAEDPGDADGWGDSFADAAF